MENRNTGTVAIIGFGVMGEALARSMIDRELAPGGIIASDTDPDRMREAERLGISVTSSGAPAAIGAELIILSVKPQSMARVLDQIRETPLEDRLIISIAAGHTTRSIEEALGQRAAVVRAMPSLPLTVGEGVIALARGSFSSSSDMERARAVFEHSGRVFEVNESMMDAVTGFTASGPAFAAVVIEALSDAGVRVGFSRDRATAMAAQTILGAARMILDTGTHPAVLKDRVASAGGTAMAGLHALERSAIRAGLMDAVVAATTRSAEMMGQSGAVRRGASPPLRAVRGVDETV